jgi:hypothetical protein
MGIEMLRSDLNTLYQPVILVEMRNGCSAIKSAFFNQNAGSRIFWWFLCVHQHPNQLVRILLVGQHGCCHAVPSAPCEDRTDFNISPNGPPNPCEGMQNDEPLGIEGMVEFMVGAGSYRETPFLHQ